MSTLSNATWLFGGFLIGYTHASLVESWCHDRVWHASKRTLARSRRVPIVGTRLRNAWKSHGVVHHAMSFRRDHITQFASSAEHERAHAYFRDNGLALANDFGLTVSMGGFVRFMLPFMLVSSIVAIVAPPLFALPFALMSLTPALLSTFVHPYMHMPLSQALQTASWPMGLLLRSRLGQLMWVHHFVHHRHPQVCFNLGLPIGDWLRGVYRRPNSQDWVELRSVGGPGIVDAPTAEVADARASSQSTRRSTSGTLQASSAMSSSASVREATSSAK